jgi:hypothetical protein
MKRKKWVIFALLVAVAPALVARGDEWDGVAFQQRAPQGMFAWLVLPTRMVLDDADLPPNLTEPPAVYRLSAGRNENECVQLVLMLATPADDVSVEFGEFAGDGGAMIAPAAWSANLVGQVPGHVPQRAASMLKSWPVRGPEAKADQITPGTYSPTASKLVPDPLLRDERFDLDRGLNRIWLTVRVPKDARPGDYRGVVRIRREEQTLFEVPVSLRVWNHVLPDESSINVMADVSAELPPGTSGEPRALWDQLKPYYDNLKAHRINATGEIFPLPAWRRETPPPDMREYERALKYVLDDLGFARFRFPGLGAAAGGKWEGIDVFAGDAPQQVADGTWISGAAFTKSFPAPVPPAKGSPSPEDVSLPHWTRVATAGAGQEDEFGGATLAGYSEKPPAWVEYEFETTGEDPVAVWLQVAPVHARERKLVSVDGQELGTLANEAFLKNPLGFARVEKSLKLPRGKHTLRVTVEDVIGAADPIFGVFVTPNENPDFDLLLRERAKLSDSFTYAFEYHTRQVGDWLRQRKWMKKSHAKLAGEIGVGEYGRVASVYDYLGELLPTIRREIPDQPTPMLRKSAEVWTPHLSNVNFDPDAGPSMGPSMVKPGDELWAYHNFLHTLGYPSISMRLIPWTLGRHGVKGYMFWSVNYWGSDPWTDPAENGSHMRGTLLYPDPKTGEPVNSVRWELFREGLEDFETLRMLRTAMDETYGAGKVDAAKKALLDEGEKLLGEDFGAFVRNARDFSWDPAELERIRTGAGELLSKLTTP